MKIRVKNKKMALVIIFAMLLQCLSLMVLAALEDDTAPIGQWTFDEGEGTTVADTSGNDNHGTVAGPTWTDGVVGTALSFSGNGCVEVPHHASLSPRNALTIEAWVNPSTTMNWRKVISKSVGNNTDYSIFQGAENNLAFSIKMGSVARTAYATANSVPLGEWTYVVGTYDGSRMKLYLNGNLVKTINISGQINTHNEPLRIGGENPGAYFEGMIDEVKIYNEALSAAEILDRYNSVVNPVTDATISPQEMIFDKNAPSDVTVTMELNGNELIALKNGEEELANNTDYIISEADHTVTIKQEYLMQLPIGITNITFDFSAGNDPVLAINIEENELRTCIGQWTFDEGEGTTVADTSGNDNHGTVAGPTWTDGVVGTTLSFSGNGCVEVPHHASLSPRNALTIEAWVNPSTTMNWRKVISKSVGNNTDYSIFQGAENNLAFSIKMGSVARTAYATANSVPLGEWTYVVGTYDGSRMKLYLNGNLVKTINISGQINTHNEPLRIGGENPGAYFEGMIDEVKIHNEALSAAEILDRYNSVVNPVTDATISPQEMIFDKNAPSDVTVTMELNGNELIALKNGEEELANNTDYIISEADHTVTIKQEYLMQLPIGITNITFDFSAGNDPVLAINIEENELRTCIGQWTFDEGEGTTVADTSGNDNHGTVAGPTWTDGVVGTTLSFSGNGCVEVPHHASLSPRNALTIEAWVNPSTTMNWRKVISKSVGNNTDYSIFQGAENNLAFSIKMGSVARTAYAPANSVPLGEWTYVVGTYDGSRMKLYLNGNLVKTINISGQINTHNEPLRIGGENPGAYFEGMIDEVKIYNEALSAAEILDRYNTVINPVTDATISPQEEIFDKNAPSDVTVTMELNGNSLVDLKNGETQLIEGTDYTVSGNTVTIHQAYLSQQAIGPTNLTFDFSAGNAPVLAITIVDTSTPDEPILLEAATTTDGTQILLMFDRAIALLPVAPAGFVVTVDGVDTAIQAVGLNSNTAIIEITLNEAVNCNDDLEISYATGTVTAQDGTVLASFTPKTVINNSTVRPPAPEQNMFYNNLNQLTEIRFPSGKVAKYTYDLNGNLIRIEIIE